MLIVADVEIDIIALAESVAPGEPPEEPSGNLGPDYTIELEQEKSTYVAWEPVYPQWIPEGYEISFVRDPAYGQQDIRYENTAGDEIAYTFYFRLGQWGRQFDGIGQPEEVTINGSLGYRLGSKLIWTDEAKGFGFELVGIPGVDLIAIAESVGIGPELEPTNAAKTQKALAELGDYRITQLPEGMTEDALTGIPLEDGGGWYSYIRRWYVNPSTNAQLYFEYETYTAEPPLPLDKMVQNFVGDSPIEQCTIHGCTGAISQGDSDASVVWIAGTETHGVYFKLVSSDFSARELLTMAQSVQKK